MLESPCIHEIERYYRALDGRGAWVLGYFLHHLGSLEETRPAMLPEEPDVFATVGPEGITVLFSVSAEMGLRPHFHESLDPQERDRLWRHLATFCEQFRGELEEAAMGDIPTETRQRPLEWWQTLREKLQEVANQGKLVENVGAIPI